MQVPKDLRNEGGILVSTMADILDVDGAGVQVTVTDLGNIKLTVDSTSYPSQAVHLDPDDAVALADLLRLRAREARGVR